MKKENVKYAFMVIAILVFLGNAVIMIYVKSELHDLQHSYIGGKRLVIVKNHDIARYENIPTEKNPQCGMTWMKKAKIIGGYVPTKATAVQIAEVALFSEIGSNANEKLAEYVTLVDDSIWVVHFVQVLKKDESGFGGNCYVCIDKETGKIKYIRQEK